MRNCDGAKFAALLVAACLAFAPPDPAQASASVACSIDDKAVQLSVEGAFSRGVGEAVMTFGGTIEVLAKSTPEDLRKISLEREHLTQSWLYGKDIKLRMYREREGNSLPHGYVELVIETKRSGRGDELTYAGTYVLTVFYLASDKDSEGKTFTERGKATCEAG